MVRFPQHRAAPMRIPSPDAVLVEATDRLLSIPQARGRPLPLALLPLGFLEPVGMLVAALGLSLTNVAPDPIGQAPVNLLMGALFALLAVGDLALALLRGRRYLREARAWSPELARAYRAEALRVRESLAMTRSVGVAVTVLLCVAAAWSFAFTASFPLGRPFALALVGMAVAWIGRQAVHYAECAMPRDPDLTAPTPAPAPAA